MSHGIKRKKINRNYLDSVYKRNPDLKWAETDGKVVITMENRGFFNTVLQKLIKKPRFSDIDLDELGSCVWLALDGEKTIYEIGADVKNRFGEKAEPLYERLAVYMKQLENLGFIVRA